MTSEPDSKPGRRPPTIELKATEVEQPEATAPTGETAAADTPATGIREPGIAEPAVKCRGRPRPENLCLGRDSRRRGDAGHRCRAPVHGGPTVPRGCGAFTSCSAGNIGGNARRAK